MNKTFFHPEEMLKPHAPEEMGLRYTSARKEMYGIS